jgi:hypothetical protein
MQTEAMMKTPSKKFFFARLKAGRRTLVFFGLLAALL